ncbi:MAG: tetratricopeptide repeat protein [Gemmatimonadetes bacterium]|nr:tetratricopeptide repeat protein [Gemmatimonadota bacterium]
MKSITKLKEQARRHEAKEEWQRAIEAYLSILAAGEDEGEVELGLYNRVGDLYLRLGRPADAVMYYQQAADRYAQAGLYNNAIALCNKALRYVPERPELYRKLGQLCATQGFLTDARHWFLQFAELMQKSGSLPEAFKALEEFANLSDDPETRELLARQLQARGHRVEALEQLRKAFALRAPGGQTKELEELRAQILVLDPKADLPVVAAPAAAEAPAVPQAGPDLDAALVFGPGAVTGQRGGEAVVEQPPPVVLGFETTAQAVEPETVAPLPLLGEPTETPEGAPAAARSGQDLDLESVAEAAGLGVEGEAEEEEAEAADLAEVDTAGPAQTLAMPAGEAEETGEEETAAPLPLLDLGPLPGAEAVEEAAQAGGPAFGGFDLTLSPTAPAEPAGRVKPEPPVARERAKRKAPQAPDAAAARSRARELLEAGRTREAADELERLHAALAAAGLLEEAIEALDELAALDPANVRVHQDRVDYALRSGNTELLVPAYLQLAECLKRTGARTKATVVLQRALDLDPSHEAVRKALYGGRKRPAAEEEAYVDLSALIQAEEAEAGSTTRFVVAEQAPSGDEERDFATMLSQFKSKVAKHVGVDDPASHYDLGLAFKEMGLIDEAVAEFQTALRGGEERLKVYEELGQCFLLKEQYNVAVKLLSRALQLPHSDDAELLGVYYHLGRAYEGMGKWRAAREAYERVMGLDLDFQDVSERLARL